MLFVKRIYVYNISMKNFILVSAACGVGKTTIKDEINSKNLLENYICIDTDEVGINWWDYAGTENESQFSVDCIKEAVKLSEDKNLVFFGCLNPADFLLKIDIPEEITSSYFIGMSCSDEEITRRLKARPAERMCGSDEFIASQIEYNNWFKKNTGKFNFYIDNTNQTIAETALQIANFIKKAV